MTMKDSVVPSFTPEQLHQYELDPKSTNSRNSYGPCQCLLCSSSHMTEYVELLQSYKAVRIQSLLSSPPNTLPYACLRIHANWNDWVQSLRLSLYYLLSIFRDERSERKAVEDKISTLLTRQFHNELNIAAIQQSHQISKPEFDFLALTYDKSFTTSSSLLPLNISSLSPLTLKPAKESFSPFAPVQIDSPPREDLQQFSPLLSTSIDSCLPIAPHVLTTLSARSALSLYLTARSYPANSEVLLSTVTIPDIVVVLNHYQIKMVALDIDIDTLAIDVSEMEHKITDKTVAVLIAHLYGKQNDLQDVIRVAHQHRIEVWEDLAEGWRGIQPDKTVEEDLSASPPLVAHTYDDFSSISSSPYFHPNSLGARESDMVFFSFGTIKPATAFGGNITLIHHKHRAIYERMVHIQSNTYPTQSTLTYLSKCIKAAAGMLLLNTPPITQAVTSTSYSLGLDHKAYVVALLRGFPSDLMNRLQAQPSLPLLHFLYYRLTHPHPIQHFTHLTICAVMTNMINKQYVIPGHSSPSQHYWLYPIITPEIFGRDDKAAVALLLSTLNSWGIDAYTGATQLACIGNDTEAPVANRMMRRIIYLPVHGSVTVNDLVTMVAVLDIVLMQQEKRINEIEVEKEDKLKKGIRSKL